MHGSYEVLQYLSRNSFREIAGLDKLVLMTVSSFFDTQNLAYPAAQTIAELAGISPRKVHDSLKNLTQKNVLIRRGKVGNCHVYELNSAALTLHHVQQCLHGLQHCTTCNIAPRATTPCTTCNEPCTTCNNTLHHMQPKKPIRNQEETKEENTYAPTGDAGGGSGELEDLLGFSPELPDNNLAEKEKTKQDSNSDKKRRDPLGENDPGFCEFYALWPRRVNRKEGYSAYLSQVGGNEEKRQLLLRRTEEALQGIFKARPKDKMPYPATWINSLTWADPEADLKSDPFSNRGGGYKSPGAAAVQQRQALVQDRNPNAPRLTEAEKLKAEEMLRQKFGEIDV